MGALKAPRCRKTPAVRVLRRSKVSCWGQKRFFATTHRERGRCGDSSPMMPIKESDFKVHSHTFQWNIAAWSIARAHIARLDWRLLLNGKAFSLPCTFDRSVDSKTQHRVSLVFSLNLARRDFCAAPSHRESKEEKKKVSHSFTVQKKKELRKFSISLLYLSFCVGSEFFRRFTRKAKWSEHRKNFSD